MSERLAHRGPDDEGLFAEGPIALGHRRLSIIDIGGGHQPMSFPARQLTIVYNGEVYNHRTLRGELERRGYHFRSSSDTEVILAAYAEYGVDFPRHLDGMFAVAIWDGIQRRLVLARDRFGIKPLFFHIGAARAAFASEIKALLELEDVDRSWDDQALCEYFQLSYVPEPRTAYRAIRHVKPGSCLVLDSSGALERSYWELAAGPRVRGKDALAAVEERLRASVASHAIADVPIGAFLSGGIDSGLLVAFLAQGLPEKLKTFTVYDPSVQFYDERSLSRQVATVYQTDHSELQAAAEVESLVGTVVSSYDEPFADSGSLVNYVVCREARRVAKVALSGLGGDELFAGYARYAAMRLSARFGAHFSTLAAGPLAAIADRLPEGRTLIVDRLRRGVRLLGMQEAERYSGMITLGALLGQSILSSAVQNRVDVGSVLGRVTTHLSRAHEMGLDAVNRLLYLDLLTYLPGDLLRMTDRASMQHGLEVRVPFLDHRLVELALAIPGVEKIRGRRLKVPLRTIARRYLPPDVVGARKRGFGVPMADWLRGPLQSEVERSVEVTGPGSGLLDRDALRTAWNQHKRGRVNHESLLWSVVVFSRWAEGRSN